MHSLGEGCAGIKGRNGRFKRSTKFLTIKIDFSNFIVHPSFRKFYNNNFL